MKRIYLSDFFFFFFCKKRQDRISIHLLGNRTELVLRNRTNHPSDLTRDRFD